MTDTVSEQDQWISSAALENRGVEGSLVDAREEQPQSYRWPLGRLIVVADAEEHWGERGGLPADWAPSG